MPETYETEIKIALGSAADYQRLREALPPPDREVEQHNLFLDSADGRLAAARWALRLRLEEDRTTGLRTALIAVKGPADRIASAVHRTDIEHPLELDLWEAAARQGGLHPAELEGPAVTFLQSQVALDPHAGLGVIMRFENRRSTIATKLGGELRELLLDRTRFTTGEEDHEIEVEVPLPGRPDRPENLLLLRQVRRDLDQLLSAHGITPAPGRGGKFSRSLRYAGR